ncbi:MAG TPA: glycogen-binding domain-containing protein [Candidatus Sulfotelmatobacter sp.]|jgi:1,4-alpha-glucan branching enzyme|nr:glycogen-binding domain-containing protein [Candidatus Sulfotelmatobacter sp.]
MSHPRPIATRPVGFSKVFRWAREGPQPVSVVVAGTFNNWQRAPLKYSRENAYWQLTLHDIPGHRTHNYMILVNGKPVDDPHADGLVMPLTEEEKKHALTTPRGPRVFALFSQAK